MLGMKLCSYTWNIVYSMGVVIGFSIQIRFESTIAIILMHLPSLHSEQVYIVSIFALRDYYTAVVE